MPIALVRSISLPNLKVYTTISLLLVSGCLYYAFDVVRTDPQWKLHHHNTSATRPSSLLKTSNDAISVLTNSDLLSSLTPFSAPHDKDEAEPTASGNVFDETNSNGTSSFTNQLKDVVSFMTHEPICIWVSGVVTCVIVLPLSLSTPGCCDKINNFCDLLLPGVFARLLKVKLLPNKPRLSRLAPKQFVSR